MCVFCVECVSFEGKYRRVAYITLPHLSRGWKLRVMGELLSLTLSKPNSIACAHKSSASIFYSGDKIHYKNVCLARLRQHSSPYSCARGRRAYMRVRQKGAVGCWKFMRVPPLGSILCQMRLGGLGNESTSLHPFGINPEKRSASIHFGICKKLCKR